LPSIADPDSIRAMKVAVAGGTGVVGRHVVEQLAAAGHDPLVLARATGVDLLTADGLAERLVGVDAVIDTTSVATTAKKAAVSFFTTTTRHLLEAGAAAGVGHHLLLSIVGIDEIPFGYYVGKVAQERLVEQGPVPWSIVRAPQFHEFAEQMIERASVGPVTIVPGMRSATMAAAEVAAVVVEVATGAPQGRVRDLRGPETAEMSDLVGKVVAQRGERRRVMRARVPGKAGRLMASGALVAADPATVGTQTFDAWLAGRAGAGS
jgi:uncharacterized protein YbjT (DUF2867 family)